MTLTIDACVAQHQGDRKEQQDRLSLVPHPSGGGVVLCRRRRRYGRARWWCARGATGHSHGMQQLCPVSARTEDPRGFLGASVDEAHMLIKASRFINEKDPHSTVVVLVLQPGKVTWAHWDSRLYRFRGDRAVFNGRLEVIPTSSSS